MNEIQDIRLAIQNIARNTANQIHREEHFTIMLFASLWPKYSERLLSTTGLELSKLLSRIAGSGADQLRQRHLGRTKDFYLDLLLTAPMNGKHLSSTLNIETVLAETPITHICEFKYLTSFPSLPRKVAREDTYKLQILGEYIRSVSGTAPEMDQFVVASNRGLKAPRSLHSLTQWFSDAEFRAETRNVRINLVDTNGILHLI